MFRPSLASMLLAGAALCPVAAVAQNASDQLQDPKSADVEIVGHVLEPVPVEPDEEHLSRLAVPDGASISVFAENLTNPRMIAVADDGTVYVTERATGALVMIRDEDGDGTADAQEAIANRPNLHGIAIDGTTMYLVTVNELYRTDIAEDGTIGELELLIDDLPDAGQHPNRTLTVGPNGKLYLSVGSTCNACAESNPENATMLEVEPDGSSRTIFASGLRNTIGFAFHPETGILWGMDHGIDWLGDEEQAEELNRIDKGRKYGWPYVYADSKLNPQDYPPNDLSIEEWAAQSTEPELLYTPHAAPMQLAFHERGDQFGEFDGDAFIAMRGSWNRKPPSGYEVLRIDFEDGEPVGLEPFVTGFLMEENGGWAQLGRLAGLAVANDGAILVSDDQNGVIYRIAETDSAASDEQAASGTPDDTAAAEAAEAAPEPMPAAAPGPEELAATVLGADTAAVSVESPAFADQSPIPGKYGAEGENISPPLDWADGPEGTQSYALVMEDPDVAIEPPFVHWTLYNVPADVTALPEGVPGQPKLAVPDGALQGLNDRGSTGYFGPRPPVGDPAHHYHVQVFALDTMLDLPHGASRTELLEAMEGHVLAAGELVGTFER